MNPEIFERLDPPPGGLHRLRTALETQSRSGWHRWRWPALSFVGALATAVLLLFLPGTNPPNGLQTDHPAAVALGFGGSVEDGVVGRRGTVARQVEGTPEVLVYWVSAPPS